MPLVKPCSYPGCSTLCMSDLCLQHEPPRTPLLTRGRPFPEYQPGGVEQALESSPTLSPEEKLLFDMNVV